MLYLQTYCFKDFFILIDLSDLVQLIENLLLIIILMRLFLLITQQFLFHFYFLFILLDIKGLFGFFYHL